MVTPTTTTQTLEPIEATVLPPLTETHTEGLAVSVNKVGKHFRISGNQVRESIRDLPADQQDAIWWLSQYCHRHNLDKQGLGALLKKPNGGYYSHDSVIQLLSGGRIRRGENIDLMVEAIKSMRRIEDVRQEQITSGFIPTRLYKEIERRCDKALNRQRIAYIFGDSQIGKTASLMEYQRTHNHGITIYIEMPARGNLSPFLRELARQLNIPDRNGITQLQEQIIATFDSRMLLIVDEAHNCLDARKGAGGAAVLKFLKELWNKRKCGIVLSMTNEGRDKFLNGSHGKAYEQLWRRRIAPLQLPSIPPDDDAALFAKAYGLEPATDVPVKVKLTIVNDAGVAETKIHNEVPLALQRRTLAREGLGVWIGILQDAADMAQEHGKPISWAAVIKAACQAQADAEIFA